MAGSIGGIGGFGGGREIGGESRIHQGPPPPPPPSSSQSNTSQGGCQDGFQQSQGSQIENGQQAGPPPPPELKELFDKLKSDKQSGNTEAVSQDKEQIQEFIQNLQQTQGGGQSQGNRGFQGGF